MSRIVVLGSANVDLTVVVDRRPDWGETVAGRSFRRTVGGKGVNCAIAAARASATADPPPVSMLAAIGGDADGELVRAELAAAGVDATGVRVTGRPTGVAHIIVDGQGRNAITVVAGANDAFDGPAALTKPDRDLLAGARFVLAQLEIPLSGVTAGFDAAHGAGAFTLLTPAPVQSLPAQLLDVVDVLVANQTEAAQLTDLPAGCATERLGSALLERVPAAVVTRGEQGADWFARPAVTLPGGQPVGGHVHVQAYPSDAVDTTGAGDCFAGAFVVGLDEFGRPEPALRFAAVAAGLSVRTAGAAASMPTRSQIEEASNQWS
jgi:ribokinase